MDYIATAGIMTILINGMVIMIRSTKTKKSCLYMMTNIYQRKVIILSKLGWTYMISKTYV